MKTSFRRLLVTALVAGVWSTVAQAEDIKLRIASGHPAANTYVNLMQNFFVPEVTKRVAAKTKHKIEFIEGYGGSMVKVADTLEGVQSGIIDIGGYCFCLSRRICHCMRSRRCCRSAPWTRRRASGWRAWCMTKCRS